MIFGDRQPAAPATAHNKRGGRLALGLASLGLVTATLLAGCAKPAPKPSAVVNAEQLAQLDSQAKLFAHQALELYVSKKVKADCTTGPVSSNQTQACKIELTPNSLSYSQTLDQGAPPTYSDSGWTHTVTTTEAVDPNAGVAVTFELKMTGDGGEQDATVTLQNRSMTHPIPLTPTSVSEFVANQDTHFQSVHTDIDGFIEFDREINTFIGPDGRISQKYDHNLGFGDEVPHAANTGASAVTDFALNNQFYYLGFDMDLANSAAGGSLHS